MQISMIPSIFAKKKMKRVRFAPSPTGPLHIGGLRTALFNYLYAKKHNGTFILRVEDTDQKRSIKESESYIHEALSWCGLEPDEDPIKGGEYGPYRQSERKEIYKEYIDKLIKLDKAYYAFDSTEELEKARAESEKENGGFKYNAQNRGSFKNSLTLSEEETLSKIEKREYVIRLKVAPNCNLVVKDLIRGMVTVNSSELEDKILMKKDGMPTYHFANVVDDYLMKITTVIRGEEWLPSLPIHQLIYDGYGWESPEFMHLPLILNPSGKGKLSKRDGDKNGYPVFPLTWNESRGYKEKGFLPEAHINYIGQLGWSSKADQEIMTLAEMVNNFSIEELQKGGARFDYDKAKWVNQQHIALMSNDELLQKHAYYFEPLEKKYGTRKKEVLALIKERIVLLEDIPNLISCFIESPASYDEKSLKRIKKNDLGKVIPIIKKGIESIESNKLKDYFAEKGSEEGIGMGVFMQVLRVAVVGSLSGPDLIPMISLIGKNVTLDRLDSLISIT